MAKTDTPKTPKIIDTVNIDGKSYKMMCVDIQQEGTVCEIPMRIKDFVEDMERGKISRDNLIQREINQWGSLLKSNLLYSIMINRPIGTILTATGRSDTKIYPEKFKELPEILRDAILDYRLTICSYKGFSDSELDNILYCVNSGKAPTSYQKMRFALGSNVMRTIQPMCDSDLWEDVAG